MITLIIALPLLVHSWFLYYESSLTGILLTYILFVPLFVYFSGLREFPSKIRAIVNDLKLFKLVVIWYSEVLFLDSEAKFERMINDVKTVMQPTPYKMNNSIYPIMYVDKPEDIQIVLNTANALEKSVVYQQPEITFGNTLIHVNVPVWKLHRRTMSPMFNSHHLEKYSYSMNKWSRWILHELQTKADTNEIIDLWEFMSMESFNVALETLMGIDPDTVYTRSEKQRYIWISNRLTKHIVERLEKLWLHPKIIFNIMCRLTGIFQINSELMELTSRVVQHRQRILEEEIGKETESVLLDTLCDLHLSVRGEKINESLKREVFLLSEAAYDTTTSATCSTLLMLAMNPCIQDQVYQEINQILGEKEKDLITIDDVNNMHLLDRCIKESLRLYPPLPYFARLTTGNVKLSNGEVVENGTNIGIVPYLLHRQPELYKNPLVWDPNNFLPEAVQKRHPYSFIPFSGGPRGCIGTKYGMLSMRILLATILRKYRFTTDMTMSDMKLEFDFILRISNGWKVKLHTRN